MSRTTVISLAILLLAAALLGVFANSMEHQSVTPWLNPSTTQASTNVTWLHTVGVNIYDEAGERIGLHGLNIVSGQGEGVTLNDIQKIKALGFNMIRIPNLHWGVVQPFNETLKGVDESFFTSGKNSYFQVGFDQIVKWVVDENMYLVICLTWSYPWYPPPAWAFQGLPTPSPSNDTQQAQIYTALISGSATRERIGIANLWKYITNRYRDIPNVIFEILNEPVVLNQNVAGNDYKSFNEFVISAIESAETRSHLKLIQMLLDTKWNVITDTAVDVSKPNVAWASHHYDPMTRWDPNGNYQHGAFIWHGQNITVGLGNGTVYAAWAVARVAQKIQLWNRPWVVTEFSKAVTQNDWQQWYNVVERTMIENHVAAWIFFCYDHDPAHEVGWNLNDQSTQDLIMPFLKPIIGS